jgi:hypothetical protein
MLTDRSVEQAGHRRIAMLGRMPFKTSAGSPSSVARAMLREKPMGFTDEDFWRIVALEPPFGLEPKTCGLRNRCSTN